MSHSTYTVLNQPPPFEGVNLFAVDRALGEALCREGAALRRGKLPEISLRARPGG